MIAAELNKAGYVPLVVLSNSRPRPPRRIDRLLEEMEIPQKNAANPAATPEVKPVRIILVTSPYHTRRAKMIFEDTVPGARFVVTSPPEDKLKTRGWRDQISARLATYESFKFAFYLLGGRFQSGPVKP